MDLVGPRLQELLGRLAARRPLKHALLGVESGDGSFRWTGAAGEDRDGRPVLADTPFFIASIDKLFTASVVLKLEESGLLRLDDSIMSHLPGTLIGGLHRLGGTDHTGAITIRHLLSHTSGLADYLEDRPGNGRSLVERLVLEGDMSWTLEDSIRSVRERLAPHFPPQPAGARRQKVRYSDTNYLLLIAIIEAVTRRPLERVHDELRFGPLKLRRTYFYGRSEAPEPAAIRAGGRELSVPLAMRSLWMICSTTLVTLSFLGALVRGKLFREPATFDGMQRRFNRSGLPLDWAASRAPSWPIEYGMGMMRFRLPRVLTPLRAVPALVGHSGSTGSWLFHCPQLDVMLSGTVDEATAGAVPFRFLPKVLRVLEQRGLKG